jgi:acetoin utilization deacetylase AcuC-like enzyme
LSAAQLVADGARAAFALTRPPGHHAGADFFGGYAVAEVGVNAVNVLAGFEQQSGQAGGRLRL